MAVALAEGAIERLGADVGVGITGVAGPDGGTEEKPVGRVCLCAAERDGARIVRVLDMPGDRDSVRDRSTTVAMHLVRRLLLGEDDDLAAVVRGRRTAGSRLTPRRLPAQPSGSSGAPCALSRHGMRA